MPNGAQDWMSAARCHGVPRAAPGFSALPARHQRDVVCMGLMAFGTLAFAAGAVVLLLPVPSRAFASAVPLPCGAAGSARLLARSTAAPPPIAIGLGRQVRASRRSLDQASIADVSVDPVARDGERPVPPKRRNVLSRFLRGVWRTVQPVSVKADATP